MASITVSNLNVAGLDLFNDQESYLTEVTENELGLTHGGITPGSPVIIGTGIKFTVHAGLGFSAGIGFTLATRQLRWWR
jgi:hypothetical protein